MRRGRSADAALAAWLCLLLIVQATGGAHAAAAHERRVTQLRTGVIESSAPTT